ncbi:MAG: ABC transporter substrate-binding protein [Gammaproteobacteria bacterium]|nr:ABC transporter substrate-binding protein [Gammaproteobacteria bacterium]
MNKRLFLVFIVLLLCSGPATAATPAPTAVIQQTADELVAALDGQREALRNDPEALYQIANDIFLPRFDTSFAARLMLGRYSRRATPEQRDRFIDAFYQLLLLSYARGLIYYDEDRVRVLPQRTDPDQRLARVRTEVILDADTRVPVDYKLRLAGGEWKVYDVLVEGVSYVQSQRRVIGEAIDRQGLEPFIVELERLAREGRANARIVRPQ